MTQEDGQSQNRPRLIEVAFPLKQASIDSVHEKNVRHGHISTLHIWPARRPLAACRAAVIATLLPDPGNPDERREILDRLAGRVVKVPKRKRLPSGRVEETVVEETVGGILHWGRESGPDLDWFRAKIREVYGGRAPRVLDPFAGGGAIPLEAMRLGCEATAIDINPVAWFILKCTLEYPQRLAGQTRPLPRFAVGSPELMASFLKGNGQRPKRPRGNAANVSQDHMFAEAPEADLAGHVRAWGWWVLQRAKADLERFYPTIDGKPTVAYLWARTVKCKSCRATIPLLKTRWLCRKDRKRVLLTMEPNADRTGVEFDVQADVPAVGTNPAQRREHDRRIGAGTMSRSGATCPKPGCGTTMTMEDIRLEGQAGRIGTVMTALVVDGAKGKEYRPPADEERLRAEEATNEIERLFTGVPFGVPNEPIARFGRPGGSYGFPIVAHGINTWDKLFTSRQLVALGTFVRYTRAARDTASQNGYPREWVDAIIGFLYIAFSRLADRNSRLCTWQVGAEKIGHTFARFALPFTWDFVEVTPWADASGGYLQAVDWVAEVAVHTMRASQGAPPSRGEARSAIGSHETTYDLVVTDPPYYDAIPYSDLMDFFYIWLRRTVMGASPEIDSALGGTLAPKWDVNADDGELIDDASRFDGDKTKSRQAYENGMARAFKACHDALVSAGKLVVVFAHKDPSAWESLASAVIRAGFVVDASWPIQTERVGRTRSLSSAALSSSIWLVCKKRPESARPGWDNQVLEEMETNIAMRLREFWDAGIRGPDFVWAATGPALEAYSKHPVVKKANEQGEIMTVSEFLRHVRRMVVDFVVGRVLSHNGDAEAATGLDDLTAYYLLHRHDFGMADTPIGACILYAVSCGLSDSALGDQFDLLVRSGGRSEDVDGDEEASEDDDETDRGSGSTARLKPWQQRRRKTMGYEAPGGRPAPLIDQVHRLMHLWKAGDQIAVDDYLDTRGLRRSALSHQLLQALIELAPAGSEERSLLESISNHVGPRSHAREPLQPSLIGGAP